MVVTGLGLVTPLGTGTLHTWQRLIAGDCGVVSLGNDPEFNGFKFPVAVAARVPRPPNRSSEKGQNTSTASSDRNTSSSPVSPRITTPTLPNDSAHISAAHWLPEDGFFRMEQWVTPAEQGCTSPYVHFALSAAWQALSQANWMPTDEGQRQRTGVSFGCGVGDVEETYRTGHALRADGYRRVSPYYLPRVLTNMAAGHTSIRWGFQGPCLAPSTACTTGAHAIGEAFHLIQRGDADVMVAGGTEASITPISVAAFARMRALSTRFNDAPSQASRPFDADRDGFVLGEGAGALVLEDYEHALARGATVLAELCGYGMSADAFHITAPEPSGRGAALCMSRAIQDAGLTSGDIDYVNAHATSTPLGDAAENSAFHSVFGAHAYGMCFSSTKGAVGHTLGAAGAVEAAFCVLAVQHDMVPPTLNLQRTAPEFDLNYAPLRAQARSVRAAMTNSFGFGGTNASLIFAKI